MFLLLTTLSLATSLFFTVYSTQAQEGEFQEPLLTINPPSAFLKTKNFSYVDIHFSQDDQFAIVSSGLGSVHPGIEHLNCNTGETRTLVEVNRLEHCYFPPEQDKFMIAVREEGHIWIEKYDLNGERLERFGGTKLDNEQGVRVFWLPDLDKTYVILGTQVFDLKNTGKFEPLLKMDFSISSVDRISLRENHLFIPHENRLRVFDLVARVEIESFAFAEEVRSINVSSDSNRVFVVSSATGYYLDPSTLTVADWKDNSFDVVSEIDLPYRPFDISLINDERIVLSQPEGKTYCLDLGNKETVWEKNGGGATVSPSKKLIAISTSNRIILLGPDGRRISKIAGHDQPIIQVRLDSEANELTTLQHDGLLFVWNAKTGKFKSFQEFDPLHYCGGDLERDEFFCATKDKSGYIKIGCFDSKGQLKYDASTVLKRKPFRVTPIGEDKFLIINERQTEVLIWQDDKLQAKCVLLENEERQEHRILNCSISADKNWLMAGVFGGRHKLDASGYHLARLSESYRWRFQHPGVFHPAVFDNGSDHALFSSRVLDENDVLRNAVFVFRLSDEKVIRKIKLPGDYFSATRFALSPKGKWIACSRVPNLNESKFESSLVFAEVETGNIEKTFRIANTNNNWDSITCLSFANDSSHIVTAFQQGKIQIWQLEDLRK